MTTQPDQPTSDPRTDTRTDERLLADHVAGDREAIAVLVHRYQRILLGVVRGLAWSSRTPRPWCRRCGCACFAARRRSRAGKGVDVAAPDHGQRGHHRRPAPPDGPVGAGRGVLPLRPARAQRPRRPGGCGSRPGARCRAAARAARVLPREQRLVLEVLHLDGLSIAETAELLGIAEGTVKSRALRGQATIRAHLAGRPARQDDPAR
ncbi:sigma factor-like helix-turn-helix DNA-binding protein [Actinomycetospora sp. DW7H6]|uniref:Sigma factor-like helix-turn-helix DNA-binding protein n=2 Tax=Actinomycetospora lemnae TaxID=3019891 RepID=A0ABT5T2G2_9PSEU|nr:sigma factor-like helix-turn-helix DNA-binding protein [Actinomycetospora sp. DW7H6]MDD7969312.1 sigma factor-like helix-turn-helix DNA-binding protein [Actinomycetospora sp. DW7H6]